MLFVNVGIAEMARQPMLEKMNKHSRRRIFFSLFSQSLMQLSTRNIKIKNGKASESLPVTLDLSGATPLTIDFPLLLEFDAVTVDVLVAVEVGDVVVDDDGGGFSTMYFDLSVSWTELLKSLTSS